LISETNERIQQAAKNDRPVFISGEIGTEKAFAAKLLHQLSPRARYPLSKVNVSWKLPPDLAEFFEQCDGGSLIIHLQKEFPIDMQYTLVEMASDNSFADPMSGELVEADARILLMTSLDLESLSSRTQLLPELRDLMISQHIEIPPLRDRLEDIPALVRYALKRAGETGRTIANTVHPQVLALFRHWHWPGNAEDLLLVTAQAAIRCQSDVVTIEDLPEAFLEQIEEKDVNAARTVRSSRGSSDTAVQFGREHQAGAAAPLSQQAPMDDEDRSANEMTTPVEGRHEETAQAQQQPPETPVTGQQRQPSTEQNPLMQDDASDARVRRLMALSRRLYAQSELLKKQMSGPLSHEQAAFQLEQFLRDSSEKEALGALEQELDNGLEMVHALRRQMALLNIRQQQSAETIRDVIQRLGMIADIPETSAEREEVHREAQELADSLGKIDQIIQRVSTELPAFGRHMEDLYSASAEDQPAADPPTDR